jgi:hypothetical protein
VIRGLIHIALLLFAFHSARGTGKSQAANNEQNMD